MAPDFGCDPVEVSHHHFWLAVETHAQLLILRGDPHGTSIQVALSRHHTSDGQQSSRAEAKFICAQQGRDYNVPSKLQSTIHSQVHSCPQSRSGKFAVCFPQSHFPRQPGIFDGGERRGSSSTIVPANGDDIGASL